MEGGGEGGRDLQFGAERVAKNYVSSALLALNMRVGKYAFLSAGDPRTARSGSRRSADIAERERRIVSSLKP